MTVQGSGPVPREALQVRLAERERTHACVHGA